MEYSYKRITPIQLMTNELWKEMSQKHQGDYQGPLYAKHPDLVYVPKVGHYVKWKHMEGWIYWIDEKNTYLTIEIMVREKTEESYKDCSLHRNERCLVLCYPENWKDLEYVKSR